MRARSPQCATFELSGAYSAQAATANAADTSKAKLSLLSNLSGFDGAASDNDAAAQFTAAEATDTDAAAAVVVGGWWSPLLMSHTTLNQVVRWMMMRKRAPPRCTYQALWYPCCQKLSLTSYVPLKLKRIVWL